MASLLGWLSSSRRLLLRLAHRRDAQVCNSLEYPILDAKEYRGSMRLTAATNEAPLKKAINDALAHAYLTGKLLDALASPLQIPAGFLNGSHSCHVLCHD
jgi:hypothetical protein